MWTPPADEVVQGNGGWTPPADERVDQPAPAPDKSVGGLLSNAVSDAGGMASGALQGVMHPIDTVKNVATHLPEIGHGMLHSWGLDPQDSGHRMQTLADEAYQHPVSHVLDAASVAIPGLKAAGLMPEAMEGANLASKAAGAAGKLDKMADSRWFKAAGGTLKNSKELTDSMGAIEGADEARRLGRFARTEGAVTPLNGVESQAEKLAQLSDQSAKEVGNLRAQADLQGDAPQVGHLVNRIEGNLRGKYSTGVHAGEQGDLDRALEEVQKLQPVEKLEPSEELAANMKDAGEPTDASFSKITKNPEYQPPVIDKQVPVTGPMKNGVQETNWEAKPMGNPAFKGAPETLSENVPHTRNPYEDFRASQEDPNYIPEYAVGKPTSMSEIAKTATTLNKSAADKAKLLQASGATTDVANTLSKLNDEAIMRALTPEQGVKYQIALQRYGDTEKLSRLMENKAAYEVGGSRNRIVNNLANRALHKVGYQLSAAGLDQLAKIVRASPRLLGKYGPALVNLGPAALATTAHVLLEKDPAFADTLNKAGIQQ